MTRPKILLYLHHVDLGQRYPISDQEVVIGRSLGHILFPQDERLSAQHCRVFRGPEGMCVQDLGSAHGTVVDGRLLSPQKNYPVRDGTLIAVGGQVFKCVEPSNPKNLQHKPKSKKSSRRRRSDSGLDLTPLFFVIFISLAGYVAFKYQHLYMHHIRGAMMTPEPEIISPFEMVYKEVQDVYGLYREVGKSFQDGKLSNKDLAAEIRRTLIPKFSAAQAKIGVLKPSNEIERRRIDANQKLVGAILTHITAMAKFLETNDPKYSAEMDKIHPELEKASEEARKVNDSPRTPAGN